MSTISFSIRKRTSDVMPMTARSIRLLIICSVLLLTTINAQTTGKVSGTVIDQDTREPLIGCNVILLGTTLGASCDLEGTFFILNIPPGKYDIQVSLLGYQRRIQQGVIVNSGRTTVADFALKATVVEQEAVVVQATRPDVEPEKTSTSTIIRPEEVQQIAGMRDVSDVIGLAADVTDGHFRGGRSGEELYTLQGMGIVNPLDASSAFVPIMSAVEEVEVITSGFGAQYGNAQSGVVNISMKEGKSDRWHSTFETRMRMPQRKHFGPSVFDPKENYYLSKLLDPAIWRNGDIETGLPYYTSFGNSKNGYANDTLVQVQVAMAMWRLQMHRDLYLNYGNELDYSIEGGTGGPISESARMFLAIRSNVSHPVFPTEQPDLQRQVMGNVAADLGEGMTLRISGGIAENNRNVFPSSNSLGYYNWLWDRIMSIQYQRSLNSQAGLRFSKALSSSTFYEFKANALSTSTQFGSMPWQSSIPDSMFGVTKLNSASSLTTLLSGPDKFYYLRGTDDFRNEKTLTVSVEGSVTSQVTKDHMLNGGIQFNQYFIDAKGFFNTSVAATLQTRSYTAEPRELGLYIQDKMEFEGMIANVGLRLDVWDANKDYFVNLYNPFGVADTTGVIVNNFAMAARSKPPIIGRLQPRAGISFPIDVNTVFHLNYGSFMQRPSFQYIVATTLEYGANKTVQPISLGNPRLQPQVTNSYDVGVTKGLGEGFTLDISGYYKDVKDLIEQAFFYDQRSNVSYSTYFNRDYADIRGFRVALSKRRGMISGSINYQFGVATGKSATVSNAPPSFTLDTLGQIRTETQNVPTRDIILDFDRTHNVVITAAFRTEEDWGPSVADIYPFGNVSLSSNSFLRSGRPYTPTANTKLTNSARTPAEYNTNLKFTKKVAEFFGTTATFYCEVFNLFEDRILNYSYLFPKVNAGSTNDVTKAWENYPVNDRNVGVLYWNDTNDKTGFPVDQSFLIYDNAPRSITFGMTLEF
jgi:outer membrane receptor protein involved in Fe transport